MTETVLYGYYRSSASYRVRIALGLKQIAYRNQPVHLVRGEQFSADYLAVNPQGQVPALSIDGLHLLQSQAIIEYLEETRPHPPLLPADPAGRARARGLAQMVVADIHPLNNTRVTSYLRDRLGQDEAGVTAWIRHWIANGFRALEASLRAEPHDFAVADRPGLVDLMLVPQLYNARRFGVELDDYPTLLRCEAHCLALPEFQQAHPDRQPDSPSSVKPAD